MNYDDIRLLCEEYGQHISDLSNQLSEAGELAVSFRREAKLQRRNYTLLKKTIDDLKNEEQILIHNDNQLQMQLMTVLAKQMLSILRIASIPDDLKKKENEIIESRKKIKYNLAAVEESLLSCIQIISSVRHKELECAEYAESLEERAKDLKLMIKDAQRELSYACINITVDECVRLDDITYVSVIMETYGHRNSKYNTEHVEFNIKGTEIIKLGTRSFKNKKLTGNRARVFIDKIIQALDETDN